jgi:lipopolysaccharide/colanic/teichoic acid biosynthesis glycosyltransferase
MDTFVSIPLQRQRIRVVLTNLNKRFFDILVSLLVLILASPIYGLVAIGVKISSPGPVFFRGKRVGRNGALFDIIKFRTMYETVESYKGPRVTTREDTRITPFGRWLRGTKLNEFPQFWNVLKGEMSLVGPRPEDPEIVKTWPPRIAEEILSVRPGITSPASVQYYNEENQLIGKDAMTNYLNVLSPDKQRMDQLYVRYRTFSMDLDTLFWTAVILWPRFKRHLPSEPFLYIGPISRFLNLYLKWFVMDFVVSWASVSIAVLTWHQELGLNINPLLILFIAILFTSIYAMCNLIQGVNSISWQKANLNEVFTLSISWLISTFVVTVLNRILHYYPSVLVLVFSMSAFIGFLVLRFRSRLLFSLLCWSNQNQQKENTVKERVLIVGSGRTAENVTWLLNHPRYSFGFTIMGYIDNDLTVQDLKIYGRQIVGRYQDIPRIVKKMDIGVIILADHRAREETKSGRSWLYTMCRNTGAQMVIVPDFYHSLKILKEKA